MIEDSRQWDAQRLAARHQQLPARRRQRHDAAVSEVLVASLAALARDQQLIDARQPLALLDLVELCVHPLQKLLPWQERLDVEGPEEVPWRAVGYALAEAGSAQHAAQRIDEQRQAEALVWRVREAQRCQ